MKFFLENSNDNKFVIKLSDVDKVKYIGSKYSVKRENDKFISCVGRIKQKEVIIVFGLSTGDHIEELLKIISESNNIIVVEPDKNIIQAIKKLESYKNIIYDNRVELVFIDENIGKNLMNLLGEYNVKPIKVLVYSNYDKLFVNQFKSFVNTLRSIMCETAMRIKSESSLHKIWFECYMNNIIHMMYSTPINCLTNIFKGRPAVVVSAGPSLSKNIGMLKKMQDKAIIICGGRTLKPLLDIGVRPDFLCVADEGQIAFDLLKDNLTCGIPLVFYEGTNSNIVGKYNGEKIFYVNDECINTILNLNVKSLGYGGSVAHTCIGLAQYLGCNTILLMGQDCAFTNDKLHSDDCSFDNIIKDENDIFLVKDIHGEYVKTNTLLDSFRHRIEQMINAFTSVKFVNCTEGGANIAGAEIMNLDVAHKKYLNLKFDKKLKKSVTNIQSKEHIQEKIYDIMDKCYKLEEVCESILNTCNKIEVDDPDDNNKLTELQVKFNELVTNMEFSRILITPIINKYEIDEKYQYFIDESNDEKSSIELKKFMCLYNECKEVICFAIQLMKNAIEKF